MKSTPTIIPINKNPPIIIKVTKNIYELIALANGCGPISGELELTQYYKICPQ